MYIVMVKLSEMVYIIMVKLSETVDIFAGIIACFKAEAPDEFDPDAPITDAEYKKGPSTKV